MTNMSFCRSGASQVGGPCFSELTGGTNLDEITQFCLMATHTHHQVPSNCEMIAMVEAMYNLTTELSKQNKYIISASGVKKTVQNIKAVAQNL